MSVSRSYDFSSELSPTQHISSSQPGHFDRKTDEMKFRPHLSRKKKRKMVCDASEHSVISIFCLSQSKSDRFIYDITKTFGAQRRITACIVQYVYRACVCSCSWLHSCIFSKRAVIEAIVCTATCLCKHHNLPTPLLR